MAAHIDVFSILSGVIVVEGWSSDYRPGAALEILNAGAPLRTLIAPLRRSDLAGHFGPGAELWGFRACALTPDAPAARDIVLRFASGAALTPSDRPPAGPDDPHRLIEDFVAEANRTGGTVLEIGARARSGWTARQSFGPNVRYIGLDVAAGENVDVIADAHHLSDALSEPVDYVFSISTFEHLLMPWKVVLEINKALQPGGKVLCHSHQAWPVHDEPWDYFRFSREAWAGLFNAHTGFALLEARRGAAMSVIAKQDRGGASDGLDRQTGYGLSVCVAQKIGVAKVRWDEPMDAVQTIEYRH